MKPYLLFCFDKYYPMGGWNDFKGAFDSIEEAMNAGADVGTDHFHVIDWRTGENVGGN